MGSSSCYVAARDKAQILTSCENEMGDDLCLQKNTPKLLPATNDRK